MGRTAPVAPGSLDNSLASFGGSAVALTNANRTLVITVGGTCSGTGCGSIGTATSTNLATLTATTVTDLAANTPYAVARTFSIRLF